MRDFTDPRCCEVKSSLKIRSLWDTPRIFKSVDPSPTAYCIVNLFGSLQSPRPWPRPRCHAASTPNTARVGGCAIPARSPRSPASAQVELSASSHDSAALSPLNLVRRGGTRSRLTLVLFRQSRPRLYYVPAQSTAFRPRLLHDLRGVADGAVRGRMQTGPRPSYDATPPNAHNATSLRARDISA